MLDFEVTEIEITDNGGQGHLGKLVCVAENCWEFRPTPDCIYGWSDLLEIAEKLKELETSEKKNSE